MSRRIAANDLARSIVFLAPILLALGAWRMGLLPPFASGVLESMSQDGLNAEGMELLTRNYYEELTDVDRGLWNRGGAVAVVGDLLKEEEHLGEPGDGNWVRLRNSGATREIGGFLRYELIPDHDLVHMDVHVRTNSWGQRDRAYEVAKPPGAFRIAVVGGSNSMGYGVDQDQGYPELIEQRLNSQFAGEGYDSYEVINFSVGGYHLLERLYVVDEKVRQFHPDMILMVATMHDLRWTVHQGLASRIVSGTDLHFSFLKEIAARAGVRPGDGTLKLRQRLRPFREPLVAGCFQEFKRLAIEMGAVPVVPMLQLRIAKPHSEMIRQAELAERAGVICLRCFASYEGHSPEEIYIRPSDLHPTALGHRLLADDIYSRLLEDAAIRKILLADDHKPS